MHQGLKIVYSKDGQDAVVSGPCTATKKPYSVEVDAQDLRLWLTGNVLIQDIFFYLSASDREFLMSGLSPEGWEQVFGTEE